MTFGTIFLLIGLLFPNQLIQIFMADITPQIAAMGIIAVRVYFFAYLFYGCSVLTIYYLQSIMKGKAAIVISVLRSLSFNLLLVMLLPTIWGVNGIWLAISITELIVGIGAILYAKRQNVFEGY